MRARNYKEAPEELMVLLLGGPGTASNICFWVAQRFTAAITVQFFEAGFSG